jgi:NTP pyrophosphatase (non-canonical NTP hydrolase)
MFGLLVNIYPLVGPGHETLQSIFILFAIDLIRINPKKFMKFGHKSYIMEISEAQQLVDNWIKTTGIRYFNELTNTAILMEEVGEVARIMARQYGEQSFKKSDTEVNLADEMADVLFVLICLANQTGINLTEALVKNMEKKSIRDAERHKNNEKLK